MKDDSCRRGHGALTPGPEAGLPVDRALLFLGELPDLLLDWVQCGGKSSFKPGRSDSVHLPGYAHPAPAPAAAGVSVVPCIGRRVTMGGRAARTGMPLFRPFCTPSSKPTVNLLETPQNAPAASERGLPGYTGIMRREGEPSCQRAVRLFPGQAISKAGVGHCGTTKPCTSGIGNPPQAGSGMEPATVLEAGHRAALSPKSSISAWLKSGS